MRFSTTATFNEASELEEDEQDMLHASYIPASDSRETFPRRKTPADIQDSTGKIEAFVGRFSRQRLARRKVDKHGRSYPKARPGSFETALLRRAG